MISVSIIIPAYNEEDGIIHCLNEVVSILNSKEIDYEIIIVNDGSNDNTKTLSQKYCCNKSNISLVNKKNGGFGSAIKKGIELSSKEYVLYVPVDSPLTEEVFLSFYKSFGKADLLISYRKKRLGYTKRMLFNAWLYHFLVSMLFGLNLKDYNWIHAYKTSKIKELKIENNDFFFLVEIIVRAKKAGLKFTEFPVDMVKRTTGFASAASWRTGYKMLVSLFKFYFKG